MANQIKTHVRTISLNLLFDFRNYRLRDRQGELLTELLTCFPDAVEDTTFGGPQSVSIAMHGTSILHVFQSALSVWEFGDEPSWDHAIGLLVSGSEVVRRTLSVETWTEGSINVELNASTAEGDLQERVSKSLCSGWLRSPLDSIDVAAASLTAIELQLGEDLRSPTMKLQVPTRAVDAFGSLSISLSHRTDNASIDAMLALLTTAREACEVKLPAFLGALVGEGES